MPVRVALTSKSLVRLVPLLSLLIATPAALRADDTVAATPAGPAISDPCKLVTPEEVQAVLGTSVASSAEVHVKDPIKFPVRICSFQGKNGRGLNVSTGV